MDNYRAIRNERKKKKRQKQAEGFAEYIMARAQQLRAEQEVAYINIARMAREERSLPY